MLTCGLWCILLGVCVSGVCPRLSFPSLAHPPHPLLVVSALCMYSRQCCNVPFSDWLPVPSVCTIDSSALCVPHLAGCAHPPPLAGCQYHLSDWLYVPSLRQHLLTPVSLKCCWAGITIKLLYHCWIKMRMGCVSIAFVFSIDTCTDQKVMRTRTHHHRERERIKG